MNKALLNKRDVLAQDIFKRLTPHMCIDSYGKRDPYYLDNPERSHTMTGVIEGFDAGAAACYEMMGELVEVLKYIDGCCVTMVKGGDCDQALKGTLEKYEKWKEIK